MMRATPPLPLLLLMLTVAGCATVPDVFKTQVSPGGITVIYPQNFGRDLAEIDRAYKEVSDCMGASPAPPDVRISNRNPGAAHLFSAVIVTGPDLFSLRHEFVHWVLHAQGISFDDNYNHRSEKFRLCGPTYELQNILNKFMSM